MNETDLLSGVMLAFRIVAGVTMAAHGFQKMFRGGRIDGTAGWFDSIGMKPGRIHAYAASVTEMGSGALLALGLFTPFAGAAFIALMIVAGWTVHRANGFFIVKSGWEYNLVLAMVGLVGGVVPGSYTLDDALGQTMTPNARLAITLAVGIGGGLCQLAVFFRPPSD